MPKPKTWVHPQLGTFEYTEVDWEATIKLPAFDAFKYADDDGEHGEYKLMFESYDEHETPTPEAIALALKVVANHKSLVKAITTALWNDIQGKGPDSGMYWHGNIDELADGLEFADLKPPKKADDLLKHLGLPSIRIKKEVDGVDGPVAEINFAAAFEEEHGVGILTDGDEILGIGYSSDASPFGESDDED